jgi:hypothetical protein
MAATGTVLTLAAGTMAFTNEWLQTKSINWRIPIATLIGAGLVDGFSHVSAPGATGLGLMILIGAAVTPINGKSLIQEFTSTLNSATIAQSTQKVS